jgi:hypothetical protein
VVAQYAFVGQGGGDLSFREGDRIKVVKRTGTDQDWYVQNTPYTGSRPSSNPSPPPCLAFCLFGLGLS